MKPEIKC